MGISSSRAMSENEAWGADFFGGLNELPPEPVAGISHVLEAMGTLPAFQEARRWLFGNLGIAQGSAVLEAGCGTGVALPEILEIVGKDGRVVGFDPTTAFIDLARARARRLDMANARYDVGDIRALPADDSAFDAVFCDKVLIHAGPPSAALSEMVRVTRPGGHVGAVEWWPFFLLSTTRPEVTDAFNAIFPEASYEYSVSANLARHFRAAGLQDVRSQAFLAQAQNLDAHPFWRVFIIQQLPMFVHAGLIEEATANALSADLESLSAAGEFSASFIVQAAVGTKSATG